MRSFNGGTARPLTADGFGEAAERLGVHAAEIWAVLTVETRGCGFLADRRPLILFERHIFHRETAGRFDDVAPDISQPRWGGYGAGGAHQYARLERAMDLDRRAALRSASWGIGQVMGFHAELLGYADVEDMVARMTESEDLQLAAMVGEITGNKLDRSLRAHDWAGFARGYNGPLYAQNQYDVRLAAAHEKFARGLVPDLTLREAQVCLFYLGFDPGPIDGVVGRRTRGALGEFQDREGLASTGNADEETLGRLRQAAFADTERVSGRGRPARRRTRRNVSP